MLSEQERNAIFRANPMVRGFLGTALEDLQYSENDQACEEEREPCDVGTIYTVPDATFMAAVNECTAFAKAAGPTIELIQWPDHEGLGSDLYLERAGHGAGFRDRSYSDSSIGEALSGSVNPHGTLELYVGDDGAAWIVGAEVLA